jgi:hypothetical protein
MSEEELVEQLSYLLAKTRWEVFDGGAYSEWEDRRDWKVPRMIYDSMAQAALDFIRENDDSNKH